MKYLLKTGDYILISCVIVFIISSFVFIHIVDSSEKVAIIIVNNIEMYRISPFEDRNIIVNGTIDKSHIQVKNAQISIIEAPCRHKICIKMGKISKAGETLICVPNRIVIQILGNNSNSLDGITM
jgi:hypothetical protein